MKFYLNYQAILTNKAEDSLLSFNFDDKLLRQYF